MRCPVCHANDIAKRDLDSGQRACNNCEDAARLYWFIQQNGIIDEDGNPVLKTIMELKKVASLVAEL